MAVFYILFECTPGPKHPRRDDIGGAFVNCWIEADSLEDALHIARAEIRGWNWIVDEPDEAGQVNESSYGGNPDALHYYEQALVDKAVYIFYNWPPNQTEA